MAFQQPIARPARRAITPPPALTPTNVRKEPEPIQDSREWVLFSPRPQHTASDSLQTPQTIARSRLSDLDSLNTADRPVRASASEQGDDEVVSEDCDSLDDGLRAFCERRTSEVHRVLEDNTHPLLPTHDGLGLFPGSSSAAQAQIWRHESFNPQRLKHHLRRPSLVRAAENESQEEKTVERERFERIEAWRLEQSRAIMDEIEKQSRRRRLRDRLSASSTDQKQQLDDYEDGDTVDLALDGDQMIASETAQYKHENESFWSRLTRCVIRDLIGIDDATLFYIFGEIMPAGHTEHEKDLSDVPDILDQDIEDRRHISLVTKSGSWEGRLLARISRELGLLVHHISEHPATFSTFLKLQKQHSDASLPIPFSSSTSTQLRLRQKHQQPFHRRRRHRSGVPSKSVFLAGIEEETDYENEHEIQASQQGNTHLQEEHQYWERDLDVTMVFGYLRNRMSSSSRGASAQISASDRSNQSWTSISQQQSLQRAALIRYHHPLVSNILSQSPTASAASVPLSPILGRRSSSFIDDTSSCATQSTKRSKTRHSGSLSLESSRNYWDIGGSGWAEV